MTNSNNIISILKYVVYFKRYILRKEIRNLRLSFRTSTISLAYLRQCLLFSRFPNINGKWKRQNIRICATNFLLTKNKINYCIVMKMSFGKIKLTKYHGTADWIFPVLSKIQFFFAHNIIDENLIFLLRKTK